MKNFTKLFQLSVLFFAFSCASKISHPNGNVVNYENPDLISNGYSKESPHNKTGASNSVDEQNTIVGLDVYLRRLAGVTVSGTGSSARVIVHGVGSFSGSNEPLFVVDGMAIEGFTSAYYAVNPVDIKRVTVLTDASSAAIYGSRGGNGVIVITRKNLNGK